MFTIAYAPAPITPCVIALVVAAASTDLQCRRIPNVLVAAGLVGAFFTQCWLRGIPDGASAWLAGALVGFGLFLPLYLMRGMGAGDVKLMAAIGAFVGPQMSVEIAFMTWIIGGVWALAVVVLRGVAKSVGTNMLAILLSRGGLSPTTSGAALPSVGSLPYGVAIAVGTLSIMFMHTARVIG